MMQPLPKEKAHVAGRLAQQVFATGFSEDPGSWDGEHAPTREWIWPDWIPKGKVTALYGEGGTGKTLLALQLAVACATGRKFLNETVTNCRVYALLAENEKTDTHLSLLDICRSEGIRLSDLAGKFRIASRAGEENYFANYFKEEYATACWQQLCREIQVFRPQLVILDPIAELFWGNENDRGQASDFVRRFGTHLALESDAAVLMLAHPSKSGKETGTSGSTAWSNAVRSRLFLGTPTDEGKRDPSGSNNVRILSVEKSNFSARSRRISIIWSAGAFTRERFDTELDRENEEIRQVVNFIGNDFAKGRYWSPNHQAGERDVAKVLCGVLRCSESHARTLVQRALREGKLQFVEVSAHAHKRGLATASQAAALAASRQRRVKKRRTRSKH